MSPTDLSQPPRPVVPRGLRAVGILTRPVWEPIHRLPAHYVPMAGLTVSESIADRGLILPTGPGLARRLGVS